MVTQKEVLDAIVDERLYQDKKWGTIKEHQHSIEEWLVIMQNEMAEAFNESAFGEKYKALNEIIQVVATGVAFLEQYSQKEWLDFRK